MTILIIGGTGKTGVPLCQKLYEAGHKVLVASRSGSAPAHLKGIKFNWNESSTFENPFNADSNIDKVFLISPNAFDRLAIMKPFIDLAASKGMKTFVFLSSSGIPLGGPVYGKVHEYLAGLPGIEYAVLRPTGFIENFGTLWARAIREKDEIATATEDGKLPFVAADDIADLAFQVLTAPKIEQPETFVIGPDFLSYGQVAEILSSALGRKISHKRVTIESVAEERAKHGLPAEFVKVLSGFDRNIAQGSEERLAEVENKYVGKVRLSEWVEKNKAIWQKAES